MNVEGSASFKVCESEGLALAGAGRPLDPMERRTYLRWPVFWQAKLSDDRQSTDCFVLDFSPAGARVRTDSPISFEPTVGLGFAGAIGLVGKVVWQRGSLVGIEFRQVARQCAEALEENLREQAKAC